MIILSKHSHLEVVGFCCTVDVIDKMTQKTRFSMIPIEILNIDS